MEPARAQQYANDVLAAETAVKGQRLVQLVCATEQVVAGMSYRLKVRLTDDANVEHTCTFKIWSRPWIPNSDQVEIKVDDEPQFRKPVPVQLTKMSGDL